MKVEKKYFKDLDTLRILSCIGVLLYHLGYLKGGFLSVCSFFVLSGYLAYISLSRKENINFLEYYKNRLLHIYLPLFIVVFSSISIISFIPKIHWFNLKPETLSVVLGYNNYWQLSVNSDYFARHLNSPFMHFWYISILLQFEIVLPFIYVELTKIKEKTKKFVPLIILGILIGASMFYFCYTSLHNNIMISYYDTFARIYSLLLGLAIAYCSTEYKSLVIHFKNEKLSRIVFYVYLIVFVILQFLVDSNSSLYAIMMIIVSIITCRLIDYGTIKGKKELNNYEKRFKYLAEISYEIYLFQYPVIFVFQYLLIPNTWKLPIMIFVIIGLSCFLHFCLNFNTSKRKYTRTICFILISLFYLYGLIQFFIAKDYSKEMNQLENQLNENQKLLEARQEEYVKKLKEENDEWDSVLNDLEHGEEELKSYVANLPVVGVGDSIMLGAVPALYEQFPNGYFDAKISRTDYEANAILQYIKNQGMLADNIIIHLGTNGQCGYPCQKEIMATCEGRHVYWVTVTNDRVVHVNNGLYQLADRYSNVNIIDWASISDSHPEYFVADGIHLTSTGMAGYRETIYNAIYKTYYDEYQKKKDEVLKEHEEKELLKIQFYGNDILLNLYDTLQKDFSKSNFKIYSNVTFDDIYSEYKKDIDNGIIHKKAVFVLDTKYGIPKENYQKLANLSKDVELTFVFIYHSPYSFKEENIKVIDFSKDLQNNNDYLMVDQIHLTDKGNKALEKKLVKNLLKEKKDSLKSIQTVDK